MKDEGIRFVLLVEDEAIIALQEKIALEAEGYSVIISSDGEDAVNKACNCGYDLSIILMDIDLGGVMDGPEAARRILSVKEIPIIFLSSHTEKDIVERTEEITSYGYVVKNSGMIVLNASIKMAWKLFCEKKLVNESHSKIEKMNNDLEAANKEMIKWRSENKIHTDELIESERRFRSIVEGAPDPIFIQTDMKFTFLNEAAVRIFGSKSESELLGRNVFERFHPDYHQKIIERIGRLNKEESSVREFLELRFLRLDGTEVWVETVGEPINYDGKKGAIVFARETGLRKQAEKAIYNGKAHFDSLFENNHAVMMLIDPSSGEIYDVNPAAERFYGWNRNEMRLKKISDINTLSLEEVKTEMNKALSLKLNHFKFRHRQKEGVVRDVEVYSGPITVDGKNLLYSIVYDITDRLQAEEKIKSLLDEKEILIQEVHHRVKNNFNTVAALLNIQASSSENEETIEALRSASARVRSMAVLYEKLSFTDYSGMMSVNDYFPALIGDISNAFPLLQDIEIKYEFSDVRFGSRLMFIIGIIITELVSNSYKYAFAGKTRGKIIVGISRSSDKVFISVSDNGCGFRNKDFNGNKTGLGMRIVELLVMQIQGELKIEPTDGSRIVISFPDDKKL